VICIKCDGTRLDEELYDPKLEQPTQ